MIVRWGLDELDERPRASSGAERRCSSTSDAVRVARAPRQRPLRRCPAACAGRDGRERCERGGAGRTGLVAARRRQRDRHREGRVRGEPASRSSRCRPRTRARSGRRISASRDEARRVKTGGSGANTVAIVYEPRLTLDLPLGETVGTAMNALAHCAEALYVDRRNAEADREALAGAPLIATLAPRASLRARSTSRRGRSCSRARCTRAPRSGSPGLALAHAIAQALGGRYGLAARGDERALVSPRRCASTSRRCPRRSRASAAALGTDGSARRASRSSRGSVGSSACATSACPRTSSQASPATSSRGPGTRANPRPVDRGGR